MPPSSPRRRGPIAADARCYTRLRPQIIVKHPRWLWVPAFAETTAEIFRFSLKPVTTWLDQSLFRARSPCPMKIRKAVFPVAGLGTRVLPATKAMPKEMLTIVDRPLIQYVVDEAKEAGIEHFVFVTGRNKSVIEDHFDRMYRTRRHAGRARQEGRAGHPGARPARSRRHEFYPAAGAARPRPRGMVRPRHRRRRAVRGGAAGRAGAEHAGLPEADDRGR